MGPRSHWRRQSGGKGPKGPLLAFLCASPHRLRVMARVRIPPTVRRAQSGGLGLKAQARLLVALKGDGQQAGLKSHGTRTGSLKGTDGRTGRPFTGDGRSPALDNGFWAPGAQKPFTFRLSGGDPEVSPRTPLVRVPRPRLRVTAFGPLGQKLLHGPGPFGTRFSNGIPCRRAPYPGPYGWGSSFSLGRPLGRPMLLRVRGRQVLTGG